MDGEHSVRTLVSFATKSDHVARQLEGRRNSFYTAALVEVVKEHGHCKTITDLVGHVGQMVQQETRELFEKGGLGGVQEPCHTAGKVLGVKLVPLASSLVDHFLTALAVLDGQVW